MATNKENRSDSPRTEGEKHQGVGVNTPEKAATSGDKSSAEQKARTGGNTPNT